MDVKKLLADVTALPGVSGHEAQVSAYFAEQFRPLVDEVTVDAMYSVIAHKKGNGPKIMLCAHLDEIALMVTHIEDDGSLRLGNVGGVDPRILPASRVWVHGREKLFGTIGALPPHLQRLTPVATLFREYAVVAVLHDSPIRDARDLIERLKVDPEAVSIGIATTLGNHIHIAIAQPLKQAGVDVKRLRKL